MEKHPDWKMEEEHLRQTVALAKASWEKALRKSGAKDSALQNARRELQERALDMGGLSSAQGFDDLLELSQAAEDLAVQASAKQIREESARALERTMEQPYFARIDFLFEDEEAVERFYIGRATLMDKEDIQVYDWRAPIASVFYQHGVGPASYLAPAGTIRGELRLKRQYEIRHGELLFFFDADEQISDAFLRELLSRPTSSSMKSIVETIQREQDGIIRDMQTGLLMVQGTAGSGKTSVALHRVAYLMYQGLQSQRLLPQNILILSPNTAFERYISRVLPDLGEKEVETAVFGDLLGSMLPDLTIQRRSAWVEEHLQADSKAKEEQSLHRRIKGSPAFKELLDRFLSELPQGWIPFADIDYAGAEIATRESLRAALFRPQSTLPLGIRLHHLEDSLWESIRRLRPKRLEALLEIAREYPEHALEASAYARMLSIEESRLLDLRIRAFTRLDPLALYRGLFADREAFARLAKNHLPEAEIEGLRLSTLEGLNKESIPYDDAVAVAYLQGQLYGCRAYAQIRQLVVDEVQDMDALHITLLSMLFPQARYTMLGDIHQRFSGKADISFYEEAQGILRKEKSRLIALNKSFRCTREIWEFSSRFLPVGAEGECFSRSGEAPEIHEVDDESAQDALLLDYARRCRKKGSQGIALLCRTEKAAKALFARIGAALGAQLIIDGNATTPQGISILPLYMAKGLEFDAVLLPDADARSYRDAEDKNLLYIACTRALHLLHLFYYGERSPLLPPKGEE